MKNNKEYVSYGKYMASYDVKTHTFTFIHEGEGATATLRLVGLYEGERLALDFEDYKDVKITRKLSNTSHELTLNFIDREGLPGAEVWVSVTSRGITFVVREIGHYEFRGQGHIRYGEGESAFAVNTKDDPTDAIRAAIGPAASRYDNAIYNGERDRAFAIDGTVGLTICYDWDEGCYGYSIKTKSEGIAERIKYRIIKDILGEKYGIDFAPLKKRGIYNKPPAGFMTWYALKFGASEEAVLRNTKFQREHLLDYGADTVWVDWEWCHRRYERERFDGVDAFNPDPEKYPSGLGYLAEKIKEAGFVPALWIGFTNDAALTDYEREHPEISLAHNDTWSGRYYYDITHPEYLDGFLPKAVGQVMSWGYKAIKFDTLPNCIQAHENFHANMHKPELTTYSAYRGMVKRVRELVGEDVYMLACSGSYDPVLLWGAGLFDSSRIGPDLFTWEKFVETFDRLAQFYPLHGVVIYNDPDNVVLREEYSTFEQAKTRLSVVSLLGLPLTFGDELSELPEERLDLLRRALPVQKVHPADFNNGLSDGKTRLISLNISRPYEGYLVAGVTNLTDAPRTREISLADTLRLADGEYLVWDYFEDKLLGVFTRSIILELSPYSTKVLAVRRKLSRPQLVTTNRHLTQGAAEIVDMSWSEDTLELAFTSRLVKDDPYKAVIHLPEGYFIDTCTVSKLEDSGTAEHNSDTLDVNAVANTDNIERTPDVLDLRGLIETDDASTLSAVTNLGIRLLTICFTPRLTGEYGFKLKFKLQ